MNLFWFLKSPFVGDDASNKEAEASAVLLVSIYRDVLFKFASFFGRHFGNKADIWSLRMFVVDVVSTDKIFAAIDREAVVLDAIVVAHVFAVFNDNDDDDVDDGGNNWFPDKSTAEWKSFAT